MRLENFISQLLYRYQCVTVPGFGSFITEIKPARLSEDGLSFTPPQKSVSFNFHLKHNDGLLANHVAGLTNTTFDGAMENIDYEVTQWKFNLQKGESLQLKNIGKLYLNGEHNLVFESADSLNYLKEAFGLTSIPIKSLMREVLLDQAEVFTPKVVSTKENESDSNYSWMKYAAIAILGIGLSGYFGNQWYEKKVEQNQLIVEQNVQQQLSKKIQEATFFINIPAPTVTLSVEQKVTGNYHIVAGAFKEENNAVKALDNLLSLGYNAQKISPNKYGLHPVIYGSYPTIEEARDAQQRIQSEHNPDAWILVQELK
jgi:nucleoid DNA-binding protein